MPLITLYHGSNTIIEQPVFGFGNPRNDYGLGFYCTPSHDLACEWACPDRTDGYVNRYALNTNGLTICDLESEPYGTLHWLSVLVSNRVFNETTPLMSNMKKLLVDQYYVDLEGVDVVIGYRADDSYFSFARAFLDNRISLRQLERAMRLGKLGTQIALKSKMAFDLLSFRDAEAVDADIWHAKRTRRDQSARADYAHMIEHDAFLPDDLFALDLLRSTR